MAVDGQDELIGRQVLKLFNSVFHDKEIWFAYSSYIYEKGSTGNSRPFSEKTIENNSYRTAPFVSHLPRVFYTQLLRNVKEEDLKDEKGVYFEAS